MIAISDNVQLRKDKPSGTIIINRPNRRNALSREVIAALKQGLEDLYQERSVRAVILTGSGDTFCAGTDLQEIQISAESPDAISIWDEDAQLFLELIEYMLRYPKPIICGVNGNVIGSGAALVLASDIVIADKQAKLTMPEIRLGLFSGISAALLPHRIGAGHAARIMMTAQPVDADEGLKLGIFHQIVDNELMWARCQEIATQIAAGAQQSQILIKQMLNETVGEDVFTQLSIGAANTATARITDAAIEGVNAFLEKRDPEW